MSHNDLVIDSNWWLKYGRKYWFSSLLYLRIVFLCHRYEGVQKWRNSAEHKFAKSWFWVRDMRGDKIWLRGMPNWLRVWSGYLYRAVISGNVLHVTNNYHLHITTCIARLDSILVTMQQTCVCHLVWICGDAITMKRGLAILTAFIINNVRNDMITAQCN